MPTPRHPAVLAGLLLCVLAAASGCGATGLDWVAEPEPAARGAESPSMSTPVARQTQQGVSAAAEQEQTADARPRLSHTVTLGEIDVTPLAAEAAAPSAGVSLTINNYTSLGSGAPGYGYSSFGYARSQPNFSRSRGEGHASGSSTSGPQAGQSWPVIADHGSSFPLRSAPASPWARPQ